MRTKMKTFFAILLLLSVAATSYADVVTGKVLDARNKPVAGADILMRFKADESNKWQYLQATCDVRGAFIANYPGKINFSSEAYWPIIYAVAPGKSYSVARLQPKNNVLHLDEAEIVSGRILDRNDKAVAHAKVLLRSIDGKNRPFSVYLPDEKPWANRFQTFTDENGYWKLKAVPKGTTAYLEVSDPHFVAADFSVQQGAKPLTVHVRPGAIISGRVVDENGQPLDDVKLQTDQRQNAVTNANGVFQFTGLTPRKYYIDADTDNLPLVTPQFSLTITQKDELKKLPDIVMTPGALVVGRITMAKTGEPVAGAKVSSSGVDFESGTLIRIISVQTDTDGKYQLRLPPVKTNVFASSTSKKYFEQSLFQSVDLKEGQTVTRNFEFDPGVTLSGTALDNHGQPAKNVPVIVDAMPIKSDYKLLPRQTVTDSNGNWSISGIAPRKVQVRVGDSWATDKLVTFNLPHPAKVLLHLIPQNDLPPIGRLIDTNGKPVAEIKATLQYEMPHPSPFDIKTNTVLISDKNGYLHFRMPLVASSSMISDVGTKGYQWINGGDWDNKTQRFSDVILNPLTRRINGRIIDAHGKPLSGARVLAVALGKAETITNEKGEFYFASLPHQQITLLAIGVAGVAKVTPASSIKTVTLKLSPLQHHFFGAYQKKQSIDKNRRKTLEKFREAYARDADLPGENARLAGLIFDIDPSEGKVLLDNLLKMYWQQSNTDSIFGMSAGDLAYYLAKYKPRESWLMLQTEWAQSAFSQSSASSQQNIVLAMSAVDLNVAADWAHRINGTVSPDETLSEVRRNTQRWLSEIASATPEQRRNLCLDCFLFSESYKPGDPPVWQRAMPFPTSS